MQVFANIIWHFPFMGFISAGRSESPACQLFREFVRDNFHD